MEEKSFSFFCNVYAKQADKLVTLDQIRELITNETLRRNTFEIRQLRKEGRTDEADRLKRSLPAITVSARFDRRAKIRQGNCYATMLRLTVSLNRKGFCYGEAAAECVRRYSQPGFEEPEIRQAVNYVYKTDASQHAVNRQKGASTLSPSVTIFGGYSKSVKVV